MTEQGGLDTLDAFQISITTLEAGHQVRHSDHGHVVQGFQCAEALPFGDIPLELRSAHRQGLLLSTLQGIAPVCGATFGQFARLANHFDLDQFRLGVDHRLHIAGTNTHGQALKTLGLSAATVDDQHEFVSLLQGFVLPLSRRWGSLVLHYDSDFIPYWATMPGLEQQAVRLGITHTGQGSLRLPGHRRIVAHPQCVYTDDVAPTAAVGEVPVHRVGQISSLDKAAELLSELVPVGDQCGPVQ